MLKILFLLLSYLPNRWAQRLGSATGALLYHFDNREKHVATTNIALCFADADPAWQQNLLKQALKENAKTLLELPKICRLGGQYAIALVNRIEGLSHYHAAIEHGCGVIVISPHLGNWELVLHYLNQFSPATVMYAPPKQAFLDPILRQSRQSTGATLVPTDGSGVRQLLKQLKKGGVIGILPDQVPKHRNAGVYAPFMGKMALTMTLVNSLAKRSGATVLVAFAERLSDGSYCLHMNPVSPDIADNDAVIAATALNQGVADCLRVAPEQYLWTYKRFKNQPDGLESPY